MDLICYPLMSTSTKKRMRRRFRFTPHKLNRTYHYTPGTSLVTRLANELRMSEAAIRKQIAEERLYLLRDVYGTDITKAHV